MGILFMGHLVCLVIPALLCCTLCLIVITGVHVSRMLVKTLLCVYVSSVLFDTEIKQNTAAVTYEIGITFSYFSSVWSSHVIAPCPPIDSILRLMTVWSPTVVSHLVVVVGLCTDDPKDF